MFHPRGPTFLELTKQALSSTTHGYDLLAPKFEYTPFRTPDELLGPLAEAAAEDGPIRRALDVCCGTGAVMKFLRPHCTEEVVGIDLSEGMLEQARREVPLAPGDAEVTLIQGDALEMDYDAEFEVAACAGAFGHILPEDQDRLMQRIHAALVPGGRFLFLTSAKPPPTKASWWFARSFNAAMHVRNALIDPPFVMFYLRFTLERAREVVERNGFELELRYPYFETNFPHMRLAVATRA